MLNKVAHCENGELHNDSKCWFLTNIIFTLHGTYWPSSPYHPSVHQVCWYTPLHVPMYNVLSSLFIIHWSNFLRWWFTFPLISMFPTDQYNSVFQLQACVCLCWLDTKQLSNRPLLIIYELQPQKSWSIIYSIKFKWNHFTVFFTEKSLPPNSRFFAEG